MKATNNVSIPTLPTNIVKIRINLPAGLNRGVTPILKPQVAYAEMDSKSKGIISICGSVTFKRMKENVIANTDSTIMAKVFIYRFCSNLPSKYFYRILTTRQSNDIHEAKATVVTFTPPPVEPGATPIHISVVIIINEGTLTIFMSTLLNPGEREELAIKKAVIHSPRVAFLHQRVPLLHQIVGYRSQHHDDHVT